MIYFFGTLWSTGETVNTQNKRAMFAAFFAAAALGIAAFVSVELGDSPDHSADAASMGSQDKTLVGDGSEGSIEHDADVVGNSDSGQEEILPDEDPGGGESQENGDNAPASEDDLLTGITSDVSDLQEDITAKLADEGIGGDDVSIAGSPVGWDPPDVLPQLT